MLITINNNVLCHFEIKATIKLVYYSAAASILFTVEMT